MILGFSRNVVLLAMLLVLTVIVLAITWEPVRDSINPAWWFWYAKGRRYYWIPD